MRRLFDCRLTVALCAFALLLAGCSGTKPKRVDIQSGTVERLVSGYYSGHPVEAYLEDLSMPTEAYMLRTRDLALGLQGWVRVPARDLKDWLDAQQDAGFAEHAYILRSRIRLTEHRDLIADLALQVAGVAMAAAGAKREDSLRFTFDEYRLLLGSTKDSLEVRTEDLYGDKMLGLDPWVTYETQYDAGPVFDLWMYAERGAVVAYNYPVKDDFGRVRSFAQNAADLPPAADSLLGMILKDGAESEP